MLGFALHGAQWDDGLNAIPFAVPEHCLGETLAGQQTIATFARPRWLVGMLTSSSKGRLSFRLGNIACGNEFLKAKEMQNSHEH